MAVENYLTNYGASVGEKSEPTSNAHEVIRLIGAAAVAVANDDGSTFLLLKNVPSSFRPARATLITDGVAGGTDYEVGVYDSRTGAVVSKGLFVTGQTLATASRVLDGLANVSVVDLAARKTIAELLGLTPTTAKATYDIVLTGDTVGTGAGNVMYILEGAAA